MLTACLFAVPMFCTWSVINSVAWYQGSTKALPFTTIVLVIMIWLFVGFPLTVLGGILGKKAASPFDAPCRTKPVCHCYRHNSKISSKHGESKVVHLLLHRSPGSSVQYRVPYLVRDVTGGDVLMMDCDRWSARFRRCRGISRDLHICWSAGSFRSPRSRSSYTTFSPQSGVGSGTSIVCACRCVARYSTNTSVAPEK